jgi:hypothetical protein
MDQLETHRLIPPQTVVDRMRTFPMNEMGPRLMQAHDPDQPPEDEVNHDHAAPTT